ncbi:hypothetical protein SFC88_11680 [Nocardioides sp. HM23]|uniref:hypothetical protein n=1 Tax=Nocardioides bizhenqiangii TaxID=3095076 RepID=UPI002ACA5CBF|nr:hypothetical protein [Nocardioides sp. HM23]MDZ5621495.1 hypothetical protein [Nocardioides sp. HM23]
MGQRNHRKWIVLAVTGAVVALCAGVAALLVVRSALERANDDPSAVEPGDGFRHDSFVADDGWQVVEERGDFDIVDLTITNTTLRPRPAFLEFSVYRADEVVGVISCSVGPLGARESDVMDCFSAAEFVDDYDRVEVADTF